MLKVKHLHRDDFTLTKKSAYRCVGVSFTAGVPSPSPSVTPLPKGEAQAVPEFGMNVILPLRPYFR